MMRHCNGNDPNLIAKDEENGRFETCTNGCRFDDVDRSVIYPHAKIRLLSDLAPEEVEKIMKGIERE